MKSQSIRLPFTICLAISYASMLLSGIAQGTAFTYQGRLYDGANPANGKYDLRFNVYSLVSGGSLLAGPVTNSPVVVSNGLFTTAIDFGADVFNGQTCWLDIAARSNGTAVTFTGLTPRQPINPTPYAIYAETASATGLEGTIPSGELGGTYGNPVTFNNTSDSFSGNGSGLTGVNASLLDGLTPANFWQTTGNAGTTPGPNYAGTSDDEPFDLDSYGSRGFEITYAARSSIYFVYHQYAMNVNAGYWGNSISAGVIGATIAGGGDEAGGLVLGGGLTSYANSVTNDFGAVGGGYSNMAGYAGAVPGGYENSATGTGSFAAGAYASATYNDSFVWSDGSTTTFSDNGPDEFKILATGGVGIGTVNAPQQALSVRAGLNIDQANLNSGFINNGNTNGYGLTFGSGSGEGIASERVAGGNQYGLDFYTSFAQRMSLNNSGNLMLNGNDLELNDGDPNDGLGYRTSVAGISSNGGDGPFLYGYDSGYLGTRGPDSVALYWDWHNNVTVNGHFYCNAITINGGSDLAEPFKISGSNHEVPRGAVVVIDDQNPGHLKLSNRTYDTRVAGVVSGANGINPGIQMQQQGLLEGGQNVALTGRVYVQADTSNGAIVPGDMLTTSSEPGYAMKVTDHARAAGAILGKAMGGLSEGKGMVLVLVTLQ
ncbi:MAG TPA: hypothetical protein VNZ25_03630 [Candidatus Angelobacter sp.]|nr:hypothetical protein [Candidatus Angelobacter sp.]